MMATVDEVKSDKTKVPEEFIFRSVLLDCFTAELDEFGQLVCLRPVGILNNVMFSLNYLFQLFARPH